MLLFHGISAHMNIGRRRKKMSAKRIEPWLAVAILLFAITLAMALWNSYMAGVVIIEYLTPTVLLILVIFLSIGIAKQIKRLRA